MFEVKLKSTKPIQWVGISGSWAITTKEIEKDVREVVRDVIKKGGGIVTGDRKSVV